MKSELVRYAPLFVGLSDEEQAVLADGFVLEQNAANTSLFEAGDKSSALYLIGKGFVRITSSTGHNLATLGPGSVLGEDSLFRGAALDVTATAVSDLEYWGLADRKLRELLLSHPAIGIKLGRNFGSLPAQMEDYLVDLLSRTAELNGLPRNTLQAVASHLQPCPVEANQPLFRVGEAAQGLYIVESGSFDVRPEAGAGGMDGVQIAQSRAILGIPALLTGKPHNSSVAAREESTVWLLTADNFAAINSRYPGLRRTLGRSVHTRLSRADQAKAAMRLAQMPLFGELPHPILQAVAQRLILQHAPAGDRVYRVGEAGDALYLIESGEIELTAENASGVIEELARVGVDGYFGEMSLITGQIRVEDATATRHTNLWVLQRSDLDALITQYPAIGTAVSSAVATRLATESAGVDLQRFRQFAIFAGLRDDDLGQIVAYLEPDRYRAGEQVLHPNLPADRLLLLDSGQLRIQAANGGSWLMGPGESFGERALLSNGPNNVTAAAETDVDLWTLPKTDFDLLLTRFPILAINISRLLSQRIDGLASAAPAAVPSYPPAYAPPPPRRRAAQEPERPQRPSFGAWFRGLSTWGKIRLALLILLLIWLIGIAVPAILISLIQGTSVASGALVAGPQRALKAAYSLGSYDLAAMDAQAAEQVAMVDRQVPPTPTYTPFPTSTPLPTATPLPTSTPTAVPTSTPQPVVYAAAPAELVEPTAAAEIVAAAAAPRALDPRLPQLGVNIEEAQVAPGEQYWRLIEVAFEDEKEAAGNHHIYVELLDPNGSRTLNYPVTVFWGDGTYSSKPENKPAPEYGFNYMMYAAGYAYSVKVDGFPSDVLKGAGLGDTASRFRGIHVNYKLTYQLTTK